MYDGIKHTNVFIAPMPFSADEVEAAWAREAIDEITAVGTILRQDIFKQQLHKGNNLMRVVKKATVSATDGCSIRYFRCCYWFEISGALAKLLHMVAK